MDEAVKQAFTDAWNLYKMHSNISLAETDEYWDSFLKMERECLQRSGNPEFLRALLLAVADDIERKMIKEREKNRNNESTKPPITPK